MVIYKITNLLNGKIYIGKKSKMDRWNGYYGSGIIITQAIKKYGKENFHKEIIEECNSYDELNEREKFWISHYNATNPEIGYNRSNGGDGFSGITKETIEIIRQKNTGKTRSIEQRMNISNGKKGKLFSEEHKKRLSEKRNQRKITQEQIEKWKLKNQHVNAKKYLIIDPLGIEYITENGLIDFCKQNGLTPSLMHKTLTGERNHHNGWKIIKKL